MRRPIPFTATRALFLLVIMFMVAAWSVGQLQDGGFGKASQPPTVTTRNITVPQPP